MADFSPQSEAVAKVYAEALVPLAREAGLLADVLAELAQVSALLGEVDGFAEWCDSPCVPLDRKLAVFRRAFGGNVGDLTFDSLMVIARHGRMGFLPAIVSAFCKRVQDEQGTVPVRVTSAVALDESARAAVAAVLAERLGATPALDLRVDESILGGLIARVGDEVIDVSVRNELDQMRTTLARRLDALLTGRDLAPGL